MLYEISRNKYNKLKPYFSLNINIYFNFFFKKNKKNTYKKNTYKKNTYKKNYI